MDNAFKYIMDVHGIDTEMSYPYIANVSDSVNVVSKFSWVGTNML